MLTMKDIIRDGDSRLRTVCDEVTFPLNDEQKMNAKLMLEYLVNSQDEILAERHGLRAGVGLAAPQIGITERFFAIHTHDEQDVLYSTVIFNPKIIAHSEKQTYIPSGEGCLSVDEELPGIVPRYQKITVRGFDIDGQPITWKVSDFIAIVCQHEIDHLNGVMFYDHFNKQNPMLPPENSSPLE
ncbi:MAG: peptide deformylase [Culicoidibacterales bacterium]